MDKKKKRKYIVIAVVLLVIVILWFRGCHKKEMDLNSEASESSETQLHFLQKESERTEGLQTEETENETDTREEKEFDSGEGSSSEENNESTPNNEPQEDLVVPSENPLLKEQWLFYNSKISSPLTAEDKNQLDEFVAKWIKKELDDNALGNSFASYITQMDEVTFHSAGAIREQKCIYSSLSDIPDYQSALDSSYCMYEFIGLYTKGEYDEYGNLICYYWSASAR